MVDRKNRDLLAGLIEQCLNGEFTWDELEDNFLLLDTNDETVLYVSNVLCCGPFLRESVADTAELCCSKYYWDYAQRLLLLLRSDAEVETAPSQCGWICLPLVLVLGAILAPVFLMYGFFAFSCVWLVGALLCCIFAMHKSRKEAIRPDLFPFESYAKLALLVRRTKFRKPRFSSWALRLRELGMRAERSVETKDSLRKGFWFYFLGFVFIWPLWFLATMGYSEEPVLKCVRLANVPEAENGRG